MGRKRGVMRTECKDTRASHRKKRIGIGGNLMFMEGGIFPGYGKSYVNDDYVQAVASAGGVPMILPVTDEEDIVEAQIEAVDGLVISGGWDVDPLLRGEEPHEKLGSTLPARDTFDRLLIAAARRRGLPRAAAGTGEGLEGISEPVFAVQWHPEMMHRERSDMKRLFAWLLAPHTA